MPDRIDLSQMDSVPVRPNGFLRLRRHWAEPDEDFWGRIWDGVAAESYWSDALAGRLAIDYTKLFRLHLLPQSRILEAGCGVGQVVLALRQWGHDCWGLDYSERTIARLNEKFPEVPFRVGDVRQLPFGDAEFDAYISLGVIEHFTVGQDGILREAARILRPGGKAFVSVPALNGFRRLRIALNTYASSSQMDFFEDCYSLAELRRLLATEGLELLEYHYLNTVMTFAQETFVRPLYRLIEDVPYARGVIDRLMRLMLPRAWFGHMLIVVAVKRS